MKNMVILILLAVCAGLCFSMFSSSKYEAENPQPVVEVAEPETDIFCGIHTQEGANYYLLGESAKKSDGIHLWFYPNGDKRIDEINRAREIFAIEVILPESEAQDG